MKKLFLFTLITAIFVGFSFDADAQYRGKKKKKKKSDSAKSEYFDETGNIASKLWYGADLGLNFGSSSIRDGNGNFYNGNLFFFNIAPMVGYKITDNFSLGPKIGMSLQLGRYSVANEDLKINAVDFSVGAFTRFKFLETYFIHGEVENIWESFATGIITSDNKLELEREASLHYYLGPGYTTGGDLSFNGYALWDFSQEFTSNNLPISIRLGVTYRF